MGTSSLEAAACGVLAASRKFSIEILNFLWLFSRFMFHDTRFL
jgi:hypothetical protein